MTLRASWEERGKATEKRKKRLRVLERWEKVDKREETIKIV